MCRLSSLSKKQRFAVLGIIVLVSVAFSFSVPTLFAVSLTASLGKRVYWLDKNVSSIKRGDYVIYRHSNIATQFKEQSMIKLIRCDEGDELEVDRNKVLTCNGEYIGRAKETALNGTKLQNFVWHGQIPAGMFLPMGEHKDSYDGRYYGFIAKVNVLEKAHPVF